MVTTGGSTKTTAPVKVGSFGWQHATVQSIAVVRAGWSQPAIGMSFAELASPELFFGPCPCNGHIAPSQQTMPVACNAVAPAAAHKSITATRHTHARNLLPGALESWRILFIFPNLNDTPPSQLRKFNLPLIQVSRLQVKLAGACTILSETQLAQTGTTMTRETLQALIGKLRAQPKSYFDIEAMMSRASAADDLGALGDQAAVPALIEALSDPNFVCVCAAMALAQLRHPDAVEPLIRVLEDTTKFWVPRGAAAVALGRMGELGRAAVPALRKAREYDCERAEDKWDLRAGEAVEDAIRHIIEPSAACSLIGRPPRFEMWGIY